MIHRVTRSIDLTSIYWFPLLFYLYTDWYGMNIALILQQHILCEDIPWATITICLTEINTETMSQRTSSNLYQEQSSNFHLYQKENTEKGMRMYTMYGTWRKTEPAGYLHHWKRNKSNHLSINNTTAVIPQVFPHSTSTVNNISIFYCYRIRHIKCSAPDQVQTNQ